MHHIVVVSTLTVGNATFGEHLFNHNPGRFDLGMMGACGRLLTSLTRFGICCCIRCRRLVVGNEEGSGLKVKDRLGVVGHATESGDVAALTVVIHTAELGVITVALAIGRPKQDAVVG